MITPIFVYKEPVPYHVRDLTYDDLNAAATVLKRAFGRPDIWAEELALYLHIEPGGAQVAVEDDRIVGAGGSISYGPFAWIGVMGVEPKRQGRGIARAILDRLLANLNEWRCPIAVLDASAAGESLYVHAGFRDHGSTDFFEREAAAPVDMPKDRCLAPLQVSDLPEVGAFDLPIFGGKRFPVLNWLRRAEQNHAYVARSSGGRVTGYVFTQPGRIGPWVADSSDVAELLLAAALADRQGTRTTVRVPTENAAGGQLLRRHGFVPRRSLRHMYLGSHPPEQDRCRIYSQASFAFG